MVLDPVMFNPHHYKIRVKGKVEQSRKWISSLPSPRQFIYIMFFMLFPRRILVVILAKLQTSTHKSEKTKKLKKINSEVEYPHTHRHPQTDWFVLSEFFGVARQDRFPMLGSKPDWLKCQSKILPTSHEETNTRKGNLNAYVSHLFWLHISA